jgi:hypothetical protein
MKHSAIQALAIIAAFGVSALAVPATAAHLHDQAGATDGESGASESNEAATESATGGTHKHHDRGAHMSMDRDQGQRAHHRRHRMKRRDAPDVVINIYPGGGMEMMHGNRMSGGGMGNMMTGGMGMMMRGGMMSGDAMAMGRVSAPVDLQITVDQVRDHMAAMVTGMGGGMQVGEVKVLDEDLIDVELTDAGGTMARRIVVNRHTGATMRLR